MSLEQLLKKHKQAVSLADVERPKSIISLGPLSVNLAVGHSEGVPAGRIVQIAGRESSGKSTLAFDIMRQYQDKFEEPVLYVDFERSFWPDYAKACGVDLGKCIIVHADTTEDGMNIAEDFVKERATKLVIIDSIAAAMPSSEIDKGYDENPKMAGNAALITRFCNRMVPIIDNNDVLLIINNQLRMNFNTMSPNKEIAFGGMALKFAISVFINLVATSNQANEMTVQAVVRKNKIGAPQRRAEFVIKYGQGIDHARDVLSLAVDLGIVEKTGKSWYEFGGRKVNGLERASQEFPIQELREAVIKHGI